MSIHDHNRITTLEGQVRSLEQEIALLRDLRGLVRALESEVMKLSTKRGPGRPPKQKNKPNASKAEATI